MNVPSEMHHIDSKSNCRDYLSTVLRSHERRDTTRRLISDASEVEPKSRLDDSKVKKLGSKISACLFYSTVLNQVIKAKKKITEENIQEAIKVAIETAEVAAFDGKAFCISRGIAIMVFSTDETANKALVCAGVPEKGDKCKQLKMLEWLVAALKPLKEKGGGGKCGLAQGQVGNFLLVTNRKILKCLRSLDKNQSVVYVGVDGTLASLIYVEDQIREDGRHVVESLHKQGVSLYMLSGDKRSTTEYVVSKVGIPREKSFLHYNCAAMGPNYIGDREFGKECGFYGLGPEILLMSANSSQPGIEFQKFKYTTLKMELECDEPATTSPDLSNIKKEQHSGSNSEFPGEGVDLNDSDEDIHIPFSSPLDESAIVIASTSQLDIIDMVVKENRKAWGIIRQWEAKYKHFEFSWELRARTKITIRNRSNLTLTINNLPKFMQESRPIGRSI
ncbi:hypothetical protein HYC85_029567 [Camellia sinensis]|uniref:Uncharacterized protein n=1 Tax=Camellia sinensis TaxID=4442 RepID=A0A7J7G2C8_CAMSI|nr:hypothetical protein HYC85_029567 [Camellia sinensis]